MNNFIKKFKNKKFLIAFFSLIISLLCALGLDIPKDNIWEVFFILLSLGLITGLVQDEDKIDEEFIEDILEDALNSDKHAREDE